MRIAENIVKFRREQGLTQEALAVKSGLSRQSIQRFELNITTPSNFALQKIADALRVPIDLFTSESVDIDIVKNLDGDTIVEEIQNNLLKLNSKGRKQALMLTDILTKVDEFTFYADHLGRYFND